MLKFVLGLNGDPVYSSFFSYQPVMKEQKLEKKEKEKVTR